MQIQYRLIKAGWAAATISDETAEIVVPATYLCDAIRDFVDAVQSLSTTKTAECVWMQEPGEVWWKFRRDGFELKLRVQFDDEREDFEGNDDLLRFCAQLDRELDQLLATWGAEHYLREWRHPFPDEAHLKLKQMIQNERGRRKGSA
jgi:hypothetical protein